MVRTSARAWLVALFFVGWTGWAWADSGGASTLFESIDRNLKKLGERAGEIIAPIAPRLGPWWKLPGDDASKAPPQEREFAQTCPITPTGLVSVTNEFGEIRVETWDSPVVQIKAEMSVEAETAEVAREIVELVSVRVNATEERVDIRTEYPDTQSKGYIAKETNYVITVPNTVNVVCDNNLGDTIVQGVGGTVGLNARFGHVYVRDIGGPVSLRAFGGGEFTLQAGDLRSGGAFELSGTQAEFGRVAGSLKVSAHMSPVTIRDLAPETTLDITSESGPIHLHLPPNVQPDIQASALFGLIKSAVDMKQTPYGNLVSARSANIESKQQIVLHASFDDIYIYRDGAEPAPTAAGAAGAEFVDGAMLERTADLAEGMAVVVDAVRGDVQVVGVDDAQLRVKAKRSVRLAPAQSGGPAANAPAAIEALALAVEPLDGRLQVRTSVRDDLTALGCSYYRIDLVIECPRTSPIKVFAAGGQTSITGMGATCATEQTEGRVVVSDCKGEVNVSNQHGDVEASNCAGPVTVSAKQGALTTTSLYGKQTLNCVDGKTFVDAPQGEVVIRSAGGDVRILALDGVFGNFDVIAEKGDISIVVPETADASFFLTVENGDVQPPSILELTGSIGHGLRKYQGRLNNGQYTLQLEAKGGDIVIN